MKLDYLEVDARQIVFREVDSGIAVPMRCYVGENVDPSGSPQIAYPIDFDDTGERFFALWFEDGLFQPVYIVRADDIAEAIDRMVDALPSQQLSNDEFAACEQNQYGEFVEPDTGEIVQLTGDGIPYRSELLNGLRVEIETIHA